MLHFSDYTFDADTLELFRHGRAIPVERQPARLLAMLLASPGHVVKRTALIDALWGQDTHVNFDDNLNYCIRHLRRALDDDARAPGFIETLPRRGYRFIAPVTLAVPAPLSVRPRRRWPAWVSAAAVIVAILESSPNNHHELMMEMLRRLHALVF